MTDWDKRFMDLASYVADWSKDKKKVVGAVIVSDDKRVVSMGYNGFPRLVDDSIKERYEKPLKYLYTCHAEINALLQSGTSLKNCIMYVTMFCCSDCCKAAIQSGIKEVVFPEAPDLNHHKWGEHFKASLEMFNEAGVSIRYLK